MLALVVGLNLAGIFVSVLLAHWNRQFFDALQGKNSPAFLALLARFGGLAALYIVTAVFALYVNQLLQIRWRRWLTARSCRDWLADRSYYLLQLDPAGVENPEQRIQDDIGLVANLSLDLLTGLINAVATLGSFLLMLWTLSGALHLKVAGFELTIPGYMVWVAILYAALGTVATHLVGRSLIGINFDLQRYDAEFRFRMIRIRENAESIALSGGEHDEQESLKASFGQIWRTWWRLMKAQKRLTFFTAGYGQLAVIFPILVAAPRYFSGAMSLGGLTQTSLAFGRVQSSLSWFVDAYPRIAQWTASVSRLVGFGEALARAKALQAPAAAIQVNPSPATNLVVEGLTLRLPDHRSILDDATLNIHAGDRVLVSGPSGFGKSTLFRVLAGIWPYGSGTVAIPRGSGSCSCRSGPTCRSRACARCSAIRTDRKGTPIPTSGRPSSMRGCPTCSIAWTSRPTGRWSCRPGSSSGSGSPGSSCTGPTGSSWTRPPLPWTRRRSRRSTPCSGSAFPASRWSRSPIGPPWRDFTAGS